MKKVMSKKIITIVLAVMLMFVTVACGTNEQSTMVEENNANVELAEENNSNNEMEEQEEVQEETNSFSNADTLNGVTYSVISARTLDTTEYEVESDGYKAILVDMVIENSGDEMIDISTLMYFEIIGESGEDYGVEMLNGTRKGTLDSAVAPGKILRGEFIFETMEAEQNFALEISQDFMSDDLAVVNFEENGTYDVEISESSKDGKMVGDEMLMETLTFVITGASVLEENERMILKVDMIAKNNTGEMVTEYMIPFVLTNTDGFVNDLDIKTDNYVLSEIPANGEKETAIYFKLIEPEMKSFDLYLSPFGMGALDVLCLEVE